ncbi:hypothetical protein [Amycolatopsis sp. FDAARGOS 1241]|uniref:hypothetical protein n=1 Tax=Amycolatopsis sp. FDAARGOS 1241 TaxID=2778070 RepID=UPI00194ED603|nr:hypothetical protein [Amycolatopsis sp. FDAARGOS 1241]QRP48568.1 hypothetical protein I6J71_12420 [Amycolatopsis sp. FDAARGOS 1241]
MSTSDSVAAAINITGSTCPSLGSMTFVEPGPDKDATHAASNLPAVRLQRHQQDRAWRGARRGQLR